MVTHGRTKHYHSRCGATEGGGKENSHHSKRATGKAPTLASRDSQISIRVRRLKEL